MMPDETVDWSQFTPLDTVPGTPAPTPEAVDWSQFTPAVGSAPAVPTTPTPTQDSFEAQLAATYGQQKNKSFGGAWGGIGDFAVEAAKTTLGLQSGQSPSLGGDYGRMLGSGIRVGIPQLALGLGETVGGMLGASLPYGATDEAHRLLNDTQDKIAKSLTPGAQASNEKPFFTDQATWGNLSKDGVAGIPAKVTELVKSGEFFGPGWGDFDKTGLMAMQSLPASMVGIGPVMKAARAAYVTTLEAMTPRVGAAAAEKLASKAANRTASYVGGVSEGSVGAGQQYSQTYEQVLAMPKDEIQKSPLYQQTYAALPDAMPEDQKHARTVAMIGRSAALVSAAVAGVSDAVFASLGDRYIGGAMTGKQGILKSMLFGGASELPTETAQSLFEQLGTNLGIKQFADPKQKLSDQLGEQAVGGGLSGGLLGSSVGGGGAIVGKVANRLQGKAPVEKPGLEPIPASEVLGTPSGEPGVSSPASTPPPAAPPTATMQPRDRERPASILQMEKIANKPDYDQASIAPTPTDGAPMVAIKGDAEAPALTGREATITFANGMKVPVNYSVVEADSVLASHDITGKENPAYADPQPGTPVALNNGRVIGLNAAYDRGTADEYKARLVADAPHLGLNPDAVAAMAKPMLVRVYSDEFNKIPNIGQLSNGGGGMAMGASEQARVDAANIRNMAGLSMTESGAINVNASRDFLKQFIANAGANDQNMLVGEDKQPTAELLRRVRHAVFAKAYGGGPILERVAESTDDNIRKISNGMLMAAPDVASLRQDMDAGRVDKNLDLIPHFVQGMEQLSRMRENGDNIAEYLAQSDIVGRPFSPETMEILSKIHDISRSAQAVSIWLKTYAAAARAAGIIDQGALLATPTPTKGELITNTKERSDVATPAEVKKDIQDQKDADEAATRAREASRRKSKATQSGAGLGTENPADGGDRQPASGQPGAAAAEAEPTVAEIFAAGTAAIKKLPAAQGPVLRALYEAAEHEKPAFDARITAIAEKVGGEPLLGKLKGLPRAVAKINADYLGDASRIKDILRSTVIVDTLAQAEAAIKLITEQFTFEGARQRNLLDSTDNVDTEDGYRDAKFNVNINGHVAEIQVNLAKMMVAKDAVHVQYEEREAIRRKAVLENRTNTPVELAKIAALNEQMRAVYLPAWRASLTSATNSGAEILTPLRDAEDGSAQTRGGSKSQRAEPKPSPGTVPSETGVPSTSYSATPGGKVEGTSIAPSIPENTTENKGYGANNTLVSRAAYEAAQQAFRGTQLNAGLDPVQAKAALTMAVFHIEAGARSFAQFTDAMVEALGSKIRPYLKQLYDAVSDRGLFGGLDTAPVVAATDAKINRVIPKVPVKKTTAAAIAAVQDDLFAGLESQAQTAQNGNHGSPSDNRSKTPRVEPGAGSKNADSGNAGSVSGQPGQRNDGLDSGDGDAGKVGSGRNGGGARNGSGKTGGNRNSSERTRLPERSRGRNYRFTADDLSESGSAHQRATRNVEAAELLKQIEAEGKQATPEQQTILAKFQGWGSSEIRNGLFPGNGERKPNWQALYDRLDAILSPHEMRDAMRSTQYAHYTSRAVVGSIFRGLERMGFNGGQILEPGMGIGNFPGLMPDNLWAHSAYTGIEFDPITGGIAKQLFPDEQIRIESFVDTKLPAGFYDIAIGNPPFSGTVIKGDPKYRKQGFVLHDFFFAKSIDLVKPGGLQVFVTSHGTMDKANDKARTYLSERADLLGAIRLPQTAFKKNAGTEVVTDVLFLRKRAKGEAPAGEAWQSLKEIQTPEGPAWVNEYFAAHPEMVLGTHSLKSSMYGANEYTVLPANDGSNASIEDLFGAAVENLPRDVYNPGAGTAAAAAQSQAIDLNPKAEKEGNYYISDKGVLMVRSEGVGKPAPLGVGGLNSKQAAIVRGFIPLRDSLKQALYDQLNDGDWETSLKKLQSAYRKFVGAHGKINAFTTQERVDKKTGEPYTSFSFPTIRAFWRDPDSSVVAALEHFNEETREINEGHFLKDRVLQKPQEPEINTPQDALMVTLNDLGRVDLPAIAARIGMSEEAVIDALGDAIYQTPAGQWQTADEYLSGPVIDKLEEARIAARTDPRMTRNIKALEANQPEPVPPSDIGVQLGANWVDPAYVRQFASETVGTRIDVVYVDATNSWETTVRGGQYLLAGETDWGTKRRPFHVLLNAALNKKQVVVKMPADKQGKQEVDARETTAANEKLTKIKKEFSEWVWRDTDRSVQLAKTYNEKFNREQPRQFDGKHLTMPGLTLTFKPHDHVKRAVWRVIQTGNTYLAHAVGAGKTSEMIISAMEQKRLGLIKKPMFAVPNHMLKQFSSEFQELYPAAKIMIADEKNFVGDERRKFIARAALSEIDGLVITHASFKKIDVDPAFKRGMIEEILDELRNALEDTPPEERVRRNNIEAQIEKMEQKLAAAMSSVGKDANIRFDQMGVDMLYVDEAHMFRKLDFVTQMGTTKGLDPNGSDMAFDLYVKTRWLEQQQLGRSLVMASGTPITNTMAELYTVLRYMNEGALKKVGLGHFDAWASMFGTENTAIESDAAGIYKPVTRFAKFINVPELGQMFRQFADVLTSSQLGSLLSTRPKVEGGAREIVLAESTPAIKKFQRILKRRMDEIEARSGPAQKGDDIPLTVINDGRLGAIDLRYIQRDLKSDPKSKLNLMIDAIIKEYAATKDLRYTTGGKEDLIRGGAQLVFSDLGFGKQATLRFDGRGWLVKRLTDAGIPRSEIAFMTDYKKSDDKLKLFAATKSGKVRILIGSSKNMGTGVNVQKRVTAMQHLDSPWFPADLEQREGRAIRHGNQNKTVKLNAFATEGTYDTVMWQMLATKQTFIDQVLQGNKGVRTVDDLSDADQYAMATAMTSGDPRAMQLAGVNADIGRYQRLEGAFHDQQIGMITKRDNLRNHLAYMERVLPDLEKQAARAQDVSGDKFVMTVGGQPFSERKLAGEALAKQFSERTRRFEQGTVKVGSISGFDLSFIGTLETGGSGGARYFSEIRLERAPSSTQILIDETQDPVGTAMRLQHELATMRKAPTAVVAEVAATKTELGDLDSRIGGKFEFAGILADKRAEAKALELALAQSAELAPVAEDENDDLSDLSTVAVQVDLQDEANDGTPPKVGEDFIVYRAATAEGLAGRNAGNANSVAAHLLRQDDQESPGTGGAAATQIFVYKVKITAPFGKYETITRHTTDRQPAPGKAVGRGTDNSGNINYSFETGGAWDGKLIGTLDLKTIRDQIEEATGGRTFDDAGTQLGAQIIRGEAEAKVFADQLVSEAIGPMPLAGAPLRRMIGGKGLPRAQVAAIVKDVAAKSKFPIEIRDGKPSAFHATMADDAPGAYWNGRAYIFPQNIASVNDLYRVLAHELVGHASVIEMMGDSYPQIVKEIQNAKALRNPAVLRLAQHVRETHGTLNAYAESSEILARAAEEAVDAEGNIRPGFAWFKRTLSVVAGWLRSKGVSVSFTNAELAGLISRAAVRLNKSTPGRPLGAAVLAQSGKTLAAGAARPATPKTRTSLLDLISRKAGGEAIAKYITQPLWERAVTLGARVIPNAVKVGIGGYSLPEPYVNARKDRTAAINAHLRETKDLLDSIQGLDRNQARVAYLWMTEQPNLDTETALLEGLPDDSKAVLREMKLQVANLGKEAVELGLLTQEVYDRNNLSYLHRSYLKHEQELTPAAKAQRTAAAEIRGNSLKMRGLRDDATMAQIDLSDGVRREKGVADTALKGRMFVRLERRDVVEQTIATRQVKKKAGLVTRTIMGTRAVLPDATSEALPGFDAQRRIGKLREVAYVPVGQEIGNKYKGWRIDGTWEARWFDKSGQVGMHRDFTMEEQQRMGVIDEVRFAYAKTMLNMVGDVETARFLDHARQTVSKLTAQEVADAGGTVIDKPTDRQTTLQTFKPNEWVKVPDTVIVGTGIKKYGSLAGKFVPGAVWNDVRGTMNLRAQSDLGEIWDSMMRTWKLSKTALSPAVHVNNVMSNFILADLANVRARDITRALGLLYRQNHGTPEQQAAAKALMVRYQDSGAEMGSMLHIDLKEDVMKPLLDELQRVEATAADDVGALAHASQIMSLALHGHLIQAYQRTMMTKPGRAAKWIPDRMKELYGKEDMVFRLASFIKSVEEGKTDRQAGDFARQAFLDYEINAPWIQAARRTGLPFIAFTYRAIPLLINGMVKTPWKLAKYAAIGGGLNALFYAMIGAGGDEDKERRLLPDELQGTALGIFPRMLRMPWNDEFGSPVFLDVRRWIPGGDIVDAYQAQGAVPLPSWLGMGGPLAMIMELALNKSMFTGRPIVNDSDTMVEKVLKIVDYLYKFWTPNVPVPNPVGYIGEAMTEAAPTGWLQTYAVTKIGKAVRGETDTLGRDVSLKEAALNVVGVKVGAYPEDQLIKRAQGQTRGGLEEIGKAQADIRRQVLKGGLTEDRAIEKLNYQQQKKQGLQQKLGERLGL